MTSCLPLCPDQSQRQTKTLLTCCHRTAHTTFAQRTKASMAHIPPKYTIPPMPPHIHRKLSLGRLEEGLVLLPQIDGPAEGVLVRWGVKGGITKWTGDTEELVELGGVLGIVRLWDSELYGPA